tara:strand:- start:1785 stop:1946 length:162 start_codon:yes stop_codon:yes gene_type:complete
LDEFHLSAEAFGDAVGFAKPPHGDNGFVLALLCFGEGHDRIEPALFERVDEFE